MAKKKAAFGGKKAPPYTKKGVKGAGMGKSMPKAPKPGKKA